MPFDGTNGTDFMVLDLLTQVRSHLSHKEKWIKSGLTDGEGRFCLVGAVMYYAKERQYESVLNVALTTISKNIRHYRKYDAQSASARIMRYNDSETIRHHHIVHTLDKSIRNLKDAPLPAR